MAPERTQIIAAFERAQLRLPEAAPAPRSLVVEPLTPSASVFAGIDEGGAWALVITARRSGRPVPALRLNLLTADYGTTYQLHHDAEVVAVRACVIRCTSADPTVRVLFTTFCGALLDQLPDNASDADIESQVRSWVALFWRLQAPARTTIVGLIGELTLLDSVARVGDWIHGWHSDPTDNLDFAFSTPPLSVEVKATSSQQRVHELSMHQALPIVGDQHYFASVIVELREAGVRVGDVVDEIAAELANTRDSELFWRSLTSVCGSSLGEFFEVRYMRDIASSSLRLYPAGSIPQPVVQFPLPAGVSALRFRSDFSSVEATNRASILGLPRTSEAE